MTKTAKAAAPSGNPKSGRSVWRLLGRLVLTLALIGGVILMMLYLVGTLHPKIAPATAAAPVADRPAAGAPLVAVRKVRITDTETASGRVIPVHEAEVASQIMEKVVELKVKAGQLVKKGDVLARLDDTVLRSRVSQVQATLAADRSALMEAQAERKRAEELFASKVVSASEVEHAQTVAKTQEAKCLGDEKAVAESEATLRFATILAPMDGTVIDKYVEVGDMAKPGIKLVTIYDTMQVIVNVRESLIGRLKEGQAIEVRIDQPGLTCQGTVSEIIPEGDPVARTFPVKVIGPCKPGIRKGMYAKLVIPVASEDLLAIPQSAVTRIGQLDVVDVAAGGRLERRTVQIGRSLAVDGREWVQVLSGLREGESVVDRGPTSPTPATSPTSTAVAPLPAFPFASPTDTAFCPPTVAPTSSSPSPSAAPSAERTGFHG